MLNVPRTELKWRLATPLQCRTWVEFMCEILFNVPPNQNPGDAPDLQCLYYMRSPVYATNVIPLDHIIKNKPSECIRKRIFLLNISFVDRTILFAHWYIAFIGFRINSRWPLGSLFNELWEIVCCTIDIAWIKILGGLTFRSLMLNIN